MKLQITYDDLFRITGKKDVVSLVKQFLIHPGFKFMVYFRLIKKGAPIIGNQVWIGADAVIAGSIKIGNNVLIAPNAYVNFDVPCNSIVIGNPAKIIANEKVTEGYINKIV